MILLVFMILVAYGFYLRDQGNKIHEDLGITKGIILDLGYNLGRVAAGGSYRYTVGGREYQSEFSRKNVCRGSDHESSLPKDSFIVVFYVPDPSISRILLQERDFLKYNVPFSDEDANNLKPHFGCM